MDTADMTAPAPNAISPPTMAGFFSCGNFHANNAPKTRADCAMATNSAASSMGQIYRRWCRRPATHDHARDCHFAGPLAWSCNETEYCLTASTSRTSLTVSLMSTPPVSSAVFQVRPKASRLMSAEPSNPIRLPPQGSVLVPMRSKETGTLCVTPWMERSPVTVKLLPCWATAVDAKVRVGKF